MYLNKRFMVLVFISLAVFSLSSCSRTFFIKIEGRLGEKVTFYFYESLQSKQPNNQNITAFFVQEQQSESKWVTIWDLSGSAKLREIVYGQGYQGLVEKIPAKELRKNIKYRVVARDTPIIEPAGIAGAYFNFDESGNLHLEK